MTGPRRSVDTPTQRSDSPRPVLRSGIAAVLGLLFTFTACADDQFSPVDLEDESSVPPPVPATVSDLSVKEETETSAALTWTEVDSGDDAPASYEVRYDSSPIDDWDEASRVVDGTCTAPVEGEEVGAALTCNVEGLDAGESYDFRVATFRVAADGSRIYSPEPSNTATVELPDSVAGGEGGTGSGNGGGSDDGGSGGNGGSGDDGSGDDGSSKDASSDEEAYPNRPDGFTTLTERTFAMREESGWSTRDDEEFSIVSDSKAPKSPSEVGQALFPKGSGGGRAPIVSEINISDERMEKLYVSFWVKLSENWQGHPVVNKIGYLWTHGSPAVTPVYTGADDGPLHSQVRIQDVPDGTSNLDPNVADPEIVRGRWHRWEILLVSNTGDAADGELHWWIDGEKAGEYEDLRFGTSDESKIWEYATWRPVWGGAGGSVRETMRMWMDHYYVAGAP